jgi:hypothetical protein
VRSYSRLFVLSTTEDNSAFRRTRRHLLCPQSFRPPLAGRELLPQPQRTWALDTIPATSETVGRPPRTCGPGAALGVLCIAKNVSTAVGHSFAARRLGQDDHHAQLQLFHTYVHILYPRGISVSALSRSGRICKLLATVFAFACGPGNGATSRVARSLGLCSLAVSCCSTRSRTASSRGLRKQQMNHILLHYSACRAPSVPMRSTPAYFLCKWGV